MEQVSKSSKRFKYLTYTSSSYLLSLKGVLSGSLQRCVDTTWTNTYFVWHCWQEKD